MKNERSIQIPSASSFNPTTYPTDARDGLLGKNSYFDNKTVGALNDYLERNYPDYLARSRKHTLNLVSGTTSFGVTSNYMVISAGAAVTIATITGGYEGQIVTLEFTDANVTITDTTTEALNTVNLNGSFTSVDNGILELLHDGTSWREVGRGIGSASGKIYATFTIGAVDANNTSSSSYDYVCDGTNDDVQIQAAIDALPTTGGRIVLSEGTFTLGSAAVVVSKNGVTIEGQGKGTIVTCKNSFNLSLFKLGHASTQYINCTIRDVYFDGNQANQGATSYIIDNRTLTKYITSLNVSGCYFLNARDAAIYDASPSTLIGQNYFENWLGGEPAIEVSNTANINNNFFITTSTTGLGILGSSQLPVVTNNIFSLPASYNTTVIDTCSLVSGNRITATSSGASAVGINATDFIIDNIVDLGTGDVASIGLAGVRRLVEGNYITNLGTGVTVSVASNVTIVGNEIVVRRHGIHVTASASGAGGGVNEVITINGNYIQASRETSNTYDCILLAGVNIRSTITGNNMNQGPGTGYGRARYGVNESGNSAGPNIIVGNMIFNAQTAALNLAATTSDVAHNITI